MLEASSVAAVLFSTRARNHEYDIIITIATNCWDGLLYASIAWDLIPNNPSLPWCCVFPTSLKPLKWRCGQEHNMLIFTGYCETILLSNTIRSCCLIVIDLIHLILLFAGIFDLLVWYNDLLPIDYIRAADNILYLVNWNDSMRSQFSFSNSTKWQHWIDFSHSLGPAFRNWAAMALSLGGSRNIVPHNPRMVHCRINSQAFFRIRSKQSANEVFCQESGNLDGHERFHVSTIPRESRIPSEYGDCIATRSRMRVAMWLRGPREMCDVHCGNGWLME